MNNEESNETNNNEDKDDCKPTAQEKRQAEELQAATESEDESVEEPTICLTFLKIRMELTLFKYEIDIHLK